MLQGVILEREGKGVFVWRGREHHLSRYSVCRQRGESTSMCHATGWLEGGMEELFWVFVCGGGGGGEICHGKVLDEGEGVLINYLSYFRVGR